MGLAGVEELRAFAAGSNAVDEARVAGGDKQIAGAIEGHCPNVFALGIEEELRLARLMADRHLRRRLALPAR
jgi:hypothetical protein